MDVTSVEKSKIENSQRELRKQESAEGRTWERRYFSCTQKDELFERLGPKVGETLEADKTGGCWRWDPEKSKKQEQIKDKALPMNTISAAPAAPADGTQTQAPLKELK